MVPAPGASRARCASVQDARCAARLRAVVAAAAVAGLLAAVRPRPATPRAPTGALQLPVPAGPGTAAEGEPRRVSARRPSARRPAAGAFGARPARRSRRRSRTSRWPVTLTGRELTRVETVALSGVGARTQALNARAEPILRREALRAQSADIDVVTGATYTSESYRSSLQQALDAARRRG